MTLARSHPMTVPSSLLMVLPQPISIVALMTPGRLMGERLARLIDVVPFDPTENALNFDSRTLMMSSNRSVTLLAVVDEGLVGVSLPQAAQTAAQMSTRTANRMRTRSILSDADRAGTACWTCVAGGG